MKLIPFYKLSRKDKPLELLDEHRLPVKTLCEDSQRATELTLRSAKVDVQIVFFSDASYYGAGFVLEFEKQDETQSERDKCAPDSFGSGVFNTAQLKLLIFCIDYSALYFALEHFPHFLWGADKGLIVLTNKRNLIYIFPIENYTAFFLEFFE